MEGANVTKFRKYTIAAEDATTLEFELGIANDGNTTLVNARAWPTILDDYLSDTDTCAFAIVVRPCHVSCAPSCLNFPA